MNFKENYRKIIKDVYKSHEEAVSIENLNIRLSALMDLSNRVLALKEPLVPFYSEYYSEVRQLDTLFWKVQRAIEKTILQRY